MTDPGTAHDGPETAPDGRSGSPESQDTDTRYDRLCAALDAGWTGERARLVAGRLTGTTPDEFAADAKRLAEQFPPDGGMAARPRATDPSQGQGNGRATPKTTSLGDIVKRMSQGKGYGGIVSV